MNAGDLNQLIQFMQLSTTTGSMGEDIDTWQPIATNSKDWAQVLPLSAEDQQQTGYTMEVEARVFRLRYRPDITRKMGIQWQGKVWEIEANPTETSQHQVLRIIGKAYGQ